MASYLDAGAIVTNGTALVLYKDELGLTMDHIGQLSAILTLLFAVGALFGGRLGDRYGRRVIFTITMIGMAAGTALMAGAQNIAMLYAATAVIGLCIGADLPVSMAMIAEEAPEGSKGRLVAFSHVLWMLAIGTVQALQFFVGEMGATGGRVMWLHLLAVTVAVLVLRSTLPESKEWTQAKRRAESGHAASEESVDLNSLRRLTRGTFRSPLIALALFYGIANLAANTGGQFATLLYTELAGVSVANAGAIGLVVLAVSFGSALAFMKVVDGPSRMTWFLLGGVLYIAAQAVPLVFGVHAWTLMTWQLLQGIGGAFAGEPMWKIWSQELFPTMLRSTAQGFTTFFTRTLAAAAALVTPMLVANGPHTLFAVLTIAAAITLAIGWLWIRPMPAADQR